MKLRFGSRSVHTSKIQKYISSQDYKAAEEYLNSVSNESDEIIGEVRLLLAQVKWFSGNVDDAIVVLLDYLSSGANDYGLYWLLGRLFLADGQHKRNAETLEQAIQEWPEQPELLAILGECYRQLERFSEAKNTLRQAVSLDLTNPDARQSLMYLYLDLDSEQDAEAVIDDYINNAPKIASAHAFKGDYLYFHKYAPQSALPFYERALALYPSRSDYYARNHSTAGFPYDLAQSYILALEETGMFDLAQKVASIEFSGAKSSYWIGYIDHQLGNIDSALAQYLKASNQDPSQGLYRYMSALALAAKGSYEEATKALRKAEEAISGSNYIEWIRGAQSALELIQSTRSPNAKPISGNHKEINAQTLLSACNVYEEAKELELLIDGLIALTEMQPNNLQVSLRLAKAKADLGHFDYASEALTRITSLKPLYFDAWLQLAIVAKASGNYLLAEEAIDAANSIPDLTRAQVVELSQLATLKEAGDSRS